MRIISNFTHSTHIGKNIWKKLANHRQNESLDSEFTESRFSGESRLESKAHYLFFLWRISAGERTCGAACIIPETSFVNFLGPNETLEIYWIFFFFWYICIFFFFWLCGSDVYGRARHLKVQQRGGLTQPLRQWVVGGVRWFGGSSSTWWSTKTPTIVAVYLFLKHYHFSKIFCDFQKEIHEF